MSLNEIEITARAYCKMLLHCAKYPQISVNGVLLAKRNKSERLIFVDAIPLFHINLNLSPMYEVALLQIDSVAAAEGLVIGGFYTAEENYADGTSDTALKIASKISEYFSSPCLITISNKAFPSVCDGHRGKELPFSVAQFVDGKWQKRKENAGIIVEETTLSQADSLIAERRDTLVDFDNHLDDLRQDWKNLHLNKLIDC